MSAATQASATRGTRVGVAWIGGIVLVVLVIVVLLPSSPPPYAVTSEAPDGTDILRRVMDDLGVELRGGPADEVLAELAPTDVAVVFVDRLGDDQEEALRGHVAAGGRLVVADPRSALAGAGPGLEVVAGQGVSGPPGCDLLPDRMDVALAVDGFAGIGPGDVPDLVRVPDDATASCFTTDGLALVVAQADGTIVLSDPALVTNASIQAQPGLGQFANLFVPDDPGGRVLVVEGDQPPPLSGGDAGLPGAPPAALVRGMWLVGLAALLYALGRARRHGRVLAEDPPVEVPASELAVGIAELLQRHGEVGSAAARLRADLRAAVGPRLGAAGTGGPAPSDGADLVDPAVHATGLDRATVDLAIRDQPVTDTAGLLDVASAVRRVRTAVLSPSAEPPSG
ncbi:DUF4350 domain-containing protein [Salsipaludibacter albus]|uniref:DUF4350 domain-containing protein n=1 Tax=Salsipaludibacter albus TaxID=2849650 RepID=UPI001EE3ECDE|nr:DUF4350 domain-containing protein [Salsipaludibacter albus]MBY5164194.1 DUF4350 domain-containing protein [Salsipaludibacter albus]